MFLLFSKPDYKGDRLLIPSCNVDVELDIIHYTSDLGDTRTEIVGNVLLHFEEDDCSEIQNILYDIFHNENNEPHSLSIAGLTERLHGRPTWVRANIDLYSFEMRPSLGIILESMTVVAETCGEFVYTEVDFMSESEFKEELEEFPSRYGLTFDTLYEDHESFSERPLSWPADRAACSSNPI